MHKKMKKYLQQNKEDRFKDREEMEDIKVFHEQDDVSKLFRQYREPLQYFYRYYAMQNSNVLG